MLNKLIVVAGLTSVTLMAQGARGGGRGVAPVPPTAPTAAVPAIAPAGAQTILLNGQAFSYVSGMIQGPLVKNAPYAAEAVTETTQRLFDGNLIVNKSTAKQYRDSEGRERREESTGLILITDPVARIQFTLHPDTKTADQQPYRAPQVIALRTKEGAVSARTFSIATPAPGGRGRGGPATESRFLVSAAGILVDGGDRKAESLGSRNVEGVQADGTRTTRTIPAGEIGNTRPIEVVDERWYSTDLQMTVMTRHSDPREGETIFRLTNIQRIEQVKSLFEIPAGFTLAESPIARDLERARNLQKQAEEARKRVQEQVR